VQDGCHLTILSIYRMDSVLKLRFREIRALLEFKSCGMS
jgi:hypothetical protein